MNPITLDKLHLSLARAIYQATDKAQYDGIDESQLPTAVELAKQCDSHIDAVKKRLQTLRLLGLIHVTSSAPKRYRFDPFVFRSDWQPSHRVQQLSVPQQDDLGDEPLAAFLQLVQHDPNANPYAPSWEDDAGGWSSDSWLEDVPRAAKRKKKASRY